MLFDESETIIDGDNDSFQDIMHKLMRRAYKGDYPEGGFDLTTALGLGKVDDDIADFSLEIAPYREAMILALDDSLIPPNQKQEPISKSSEAPFDHPFLDEEAPGFFGQALQAHSKLATFMDARGEHEAVEEYDHNFKVIWGLDETDDLTPFRPSVRSSGHAMYAAIKRDLVPAVFAGVASQPYVKVHDRGKKRKDIHKRALIDWPRVKSMVNAVGVQLAMDDAWVRDKILSRGDGIKLHYAIQRKEIPLAPDKIVFPRLRLDDNGQRSKMGQQLVELQKQMGHFQALKMKSLGRVVIEEQPLYIHPVPVRELPLGMKDKELNLDLEVEFDYGKFLEDRSTVHAVAPHKKEVQYTNPVDVLKTLVLAHAENARGNVPRSYDIREMAFGVKVSPGKYHEPLLKVIDAFIPQDVLVQVNRIGNLFDRRVGQQWVTDLRKAVGAKQFHFMTRDLKRSWTELCAHPDVIGNVAEILSSALSRYEFVRKSVPYVDKEMRRLLVHESTVEYGLEKIIHQHSVYWSNRYARTGPLSHNHRVARQIASKVFRVVRFRLMGMERFSVDVPSVNDVFMKAFERYVDKRKHGFGKRLLGSVSEYYLEPTLELCRAMDSELFLVRKEVPAPDMSFFSLAEFVEEELGLFVDDILRMLQRFFLIKGSGLPDDYFAMQFPDDSNFKEGKKEVPVVVVEEKAINDFSDIDFGSMSAFNLPLFNPDTTIDLKEELLEDGFNINSSIVKQHLARNPERIELKAYMALKNQILEEANM